LRYIEFDKATTAGCVPAHGRGLRAFTDDDAAPYGCSVLFNFQF
jgi:hypothetical protein